MSWSEVEEAFKESRPLDQLRVSILISDLELTEEEAWVLLNINNGAHFFYRDFCGWLIYDMKSDIGWRRTFRESLYAYVEHLRQRRDNVVE